MTWEKFARTALPSAETIELVVPAAKSTFAALVTAVDPAAPPILQWDHAERRNPVSWYFYPSGSPPAQWGLVARAPVRVAAVVLQPTMWAGGEGFAHHGEKVFFLLEGARDLRYAKGAGFFPEFLRSEYRGVRRTMEAFARDAVIAEADAASACGLGLQKGVSPWDCTLVVSSKGTRITYRLDRWD